MCGLQHRRPSASVMHMCACLATCGSWSTADAMDSSTAHPQGNAAPVLVLGVLCHSSASPTFPCPVLLLNACCHCSLTPLQVPLLSRHNAKEACLTKVSSLPERGRLQYACSRADAAAMWHRVSCVSSQTVVCHVLLLCVRVMSYHQCVMHVAHACVHQCILLSRLTQTALFFTEQASW
jgi:hypothetical protein